MNTQILGDDKKKRRFDFGLADSVNQMYEDRLREEEKESLKRAEKKLDKKNVVSSTKKSNNKNKSANKPTDDISNKTSYEFDMDTKPAKDGYVDNQALWVMYYNTLKNGETMASMADYYNNFRQLYDALLPNGLVHALYRYAVTDLRKDIGIRLVSSTLVKYGISSTLAKYGIYDNKLWGNIIHHDGCNDKNIIKKSTCIIPIYDHEPIEKVLANPDGLKFLHKYFGTKDTKEKIMDVLEFISGNNRDKIMVTTGPSIIRFPSNDHTNNKIASLEYEKISWNTKYFHIRAHLSEGDAGRCRGVKYVSGVKK